MSRAMKWLMIIVCMIGYGELRVMSVYAAMFGIIIAVCTLIYCAVDEKSTVKERSAERMTRNVHGHGRSKAHKV